ncbi:type VI secretion system membrane subunit TssM [Oceaniglobus roseus]|uniref:type VI secretion system membrane subunit TssM n=1 Tax=Oceaniglobus roseus TaxID=1737570 RepID=UPI000C7EE7E2|nr:type VI secretion system membrane subunit TssM [Kandeliimicrobium roseum]
MRKILRALFSGVGLTIIVSLILSLCLWFFGGFLGFGEARPFDTLVGKVVGVGVIWIVALIVILVLLLRRQKKDRELAEDIVASVEPLSADDGGEVVTAELGEMREKLRAAMLKLRKSKLGRRHLYELPWYIIIGPPGAGKTTALVNSGLQFPLADEMGKAAIGGVGGTRNCDWWFTDGAVLVDTAGRYTTQESDAVADNAAWLGFLGILKKHRKRQPINGAIVAISLSDLSMQDETAQKAHASAIRRRLHELRERLGVRFPVYVLFTKADLLAGFSEFFDNLGKEDRGQVWGFTLPLLPLRGEASPLAQFDQEYGALVDRLNMQSVERMQAETDPQRRSLIAGFPGQVASVRSVAREFLGELFQDNRYEHRHVLRGVYFTSGTQEGTPIDRLMMGMARTFGIGRQAIGSGQGAGRSYFLTRLFNGVIFRESGLVSADDKVERRYRITKWGALAATVLIAVATGALWTRSYLGNEALAADVSQKVAEYRALAEQIPGSPIKDTDLPLIVPALNILRELPDQADPGAGTTLGWGLYTGDVLGNEAVLSYRAALNQMLLPRLMLRLEEQMQANINNPDLLYEALKIYLMLGLVGPMNADIVKEWAALDWELSFPGPGRDALRADLAAHLDALLSQPMDRIETNGDLVEQVRDILTRMPQAQRVYNGIINSPEATALPQFRLTDIGGPTLSRAMVRSSGKDLSEGIEGIFTYDGFNQVFLDKALGVAAQIARESFVLGPKGQIENNEAALLALSRDVLDLYYTDYTLKYDQLLADIDIKPLRNLADAVEVLNVLSGPTSPIVNILKAVAKETDLTAIPEEDDPTAAAGAAGGAAEGLAKITGREANRKLSPSARIFLQAMANAPSGSAGGGLPPPPGQFVTDRFEWLHKLVEQKDGQPSQLDALMNILLEVFNELNQLNISGGLNPAAPQGNSAALARFQQAVADTPGPLQRWGKQIAAGSSGVTAGNTRSSISAAWEANVLPLCSQVTANAYPFNRRAQADVSIQDFTRLFAPQGLIDNFFNDNLAKFVDTRTRPWTLKPLNDTDLGISPQSILQMQNAADIRDAFFAGQGTPQVRFQITPEALDPQAQVIVLEIDGQQIGFQQGSVQPRPAAITWPGPVGSARVNFVPPAATAESTLSFDGPWAWFRLLDAAEIRNTSASDRKKIFFRVGGRLAIFLMQSASVLNPFSLSALSDFSCPATF